MIINYIGKCLTIEEFGKRILIIGDLHFGIEESLNKAGVFVTRKMYEEMIWELERVFEKIEGGKDGRKVDEVVLLGDVKHEFGNIARQEWKEVSDFIDYLRGKIKIGGNIIIIKGNHDKIIEPIASRKKVDVKDYYITGEVCFLHGDKDFVENYEKKIKYWIMGHGHPAVKISDGVKVEKYKCFLSGKFKDKEIIVVPSFLEVSPGSDPRENDLGLAWEFDLDKFEINVVGESLEVLSFGKLGKMK